MQYIAPREEWIADVVKFNDDGRDRCFKMMMIFVRLQNQCQRKHHFDEGLCGLASWRPLKCPTHLAPT